MFDLKRLVVALMIMVMTLAFAGVAFAEVGHVGHVDADDYQEIDSGDLTFDPPVDDIEVIVSVPNIAPDKINMQEVGAYDVILLAGVKMGFDGPVTGELTITYGGSQISPDGILIYNYTTEVYDYFPMDDNNQVTIPDGSDYVQPEVTSGMAPSIPSYSAEVFFVDTERVDGSGGSGCSLGMMSPLALLLAVPLVLLRR